MAKVIEKSAKTVEDALKAALEELGVEEKEVNYEIIEEPSKRFLGLLGTKPAKIRVKLKEDKINDNVADENCLTNSVKTSSLVKEDENQEFEKSKKEVSVKNADNISGSMEEESVKIAESFLQSILNKMNITAKINVIPSKEECFLNIFGEGENVGILIGKHGQTLDSLQYLVNLAANRNAVNRIHFIVDVENYRVHRTEILQNLAKNLADKAIRVNKDVKLEPMSRYERKVIHTSLQDSEDVSTYSVGKEPYRYVVISPKDKYK